MTNYIGSRKESTIHSVKRTAMSNRNLNLHFVVTTAKLVEQRRSEVDKARNIRSHVMKNHIHNKSMHLTDDKHQSKGSTLSEHVSRFRLSTDARLSSQPRRRKTKMEVMSEKGSKPKPKPLVSKIGSTTAKLRIEALPTELAFSLPIETSTPGTLTLLEYYHTSFWANSLAVNPEGAWFSVALSDPAILHATLCLVALDGYQKGSESFAYPYFWHRGEAMRIISDRLTEPNHAASDTTIGAVAILSTSDNAMAWSSDVQISHIKGLVTLVDLRGGIDGIDTNSHIKRVVAWADALHATSHNTLPQLAIAKCTTNRNTKPLLNLIKRHGFSETDSVNGCDEPSTFKDIFHNLRILVKSKPILLHSNFRELRRIYCSILFRTERHVQELGCGTSKGEIENETLGLVGLEETNVFSEATKAAALIFTLHFLRDLDLSADFFEKLVERLKSSLFGIFEDMFYEKSSWNEEERQRVSYILWLCMNGWIASRVERRRTAYRKWFVEQAARICELGDIHSVEDMGTCLKRIAFLQEYCLPAGRGMWEDISEWRLGQVGH